MNTMSTHTSWGYAEFQAKSPGRTAHKISLVSPTIDVDVTGYNLKNVGTQLIDHPRDDGLRHREQLWNFQQKFRGTATIQKFKNDVTSEVEDRKCSTTSSDDATDDDVTKSHTNIKRNSINGTSSLPSRFRKRLKQRNLSLTGLRSGEVSYDSTSWRRGVVRDTVQDDRHPPHKIERMYSSGLIVKNNIFNQLKESEDRQPEDTPRNYGENTKLSETFQKYGPSLEKLPDIQFPGNRVPPQQMQHFRVCRPLYKYNSNSRILNQIVDRKNLSLRRSFSSAASLGPSKVKLRLVEKRREDEQHNDANGYNNDSNNEGDSDDKNDDDENEDDECDDEERVIDAEHMHGRDCDRKHPEYIDIRHNVTQVNTQDDMEDLDRQERIRSSKSRDSDKILRSVNTFYQEPRTSPNRTQSFARTDLGSRSKTELTDRLCGRESRRGQNTKEGWNSSRVGTNENADKVKNKNVKRIHRKKAVEKSIVIDEGSESDESLDIPGDRFGPTTHSIDKKLSIRKPWEWRPSPYRWIDRAYVMECDKPYIERIINRGEIIDEFNYDSFARTRPLKLQNFPEGAGYKDRYGVLR